MLLNVQRVARLLIHGAVAWRASNVRGIPDGHASGHVDGKLESVTPAPPLPRAVRTLPVGLSARVRRRPARLSSNVSPSSRRVDGDKRLVRPPPDCTPDVDRHRRDKRRLLLALISAPLLIHYYRHQRRLS